MPSYTFGFAAGRFTQVDVRARGTQLSYLGDGFTEDELRQHLVKALPTFKVPKYVALTDEPLPRNASEKIHRLALRNAFVANSLTPRCEERSR